MLIFFPVLCLNNVVLENEAKVIFLYLFFLVFYFIFIFETGYIWVALAVL